MDSPTDRAIRIAALQRVRELEDTWRGAIPWSEIEAGFLLNGERIFLSGRARGIFRPRQMRSGVLSIKTTLPRTGRIRRYEDIASDAGHFEYRFMGDDPNSSDNQALRESWENHSPLIYFHGVAPALYEAIVPVFIQAWLPTSLTAHLTLGEIRRELPFESSTEELRKYRVVEVKQRMHQRMFREAVLSAYGSKCAMSGLPVPRLLEAAHILPDRDERGIPVIPNGIAMSVLHHSAYDADLIGVDGNGTVHINRSLLEVVDGPTLKHSLQSLAGIRIALPRDIRKRPNCDFLAQRFEQFMRSA
jgi:putative restriction endonuclease